jgi:hypothetical protein
MNGEGRKKKEKLKVVQVSHTQKKTFFWPKMRLYVDTRRGGGFLLVTY